MSLMLEAAFIKAISIEKRSKTLYGTMSARVHDAAVSELFERLSQEEAEHLEWFCSAYPGSRRELDRILELPGESDDDEYAALFNALDEHAVVVAALELSLREEYACIRCYRMLTDVIREPVIHAVFCRALNDTCSHFEAICREYLRTLGLPGYERLPEAGAAARQRAACQIN